MPFNLETAVRPNILKLAPYRCARDDYDSGILLDANENSFGPASSLHAEERLQLERYPDPHQAELKRLLCDFRGIPSPDNFFVGVGSDESIDLAIRVFCQPARDKILICPPTYGMYSVCANINDVGIVKVPLDVSGGKFSLVPSKIKKALAADKTIKVVFLCSPGNPTGTLLQQEEIKEILDFAEYEGVVVVDEAYIDFCKKPSSVAKWVSSYPNLIVIQTLSKSFGLAGIRVGIAISTPQIARIFNNTKAPYNVSTLASRVAISALQKQGIETMTLNVQRIWKQRDVLIESLRKFSKVGAILGGNDANFVVAQLVNSEGKPDNSLALSVYKRLAEVEGIVVRFRGNELGCEGCLRISVGTDDENKILLEKLRLIFQ
ncbi:histidinol-phosphate transaminase [Entophlyctis luteolus]|nr:histidinol-phosphate transaminase [Entophlyctis luteolus]KAJ3344787.1 histidinol-phosphate transaminase [Entophlyctis luteolus]KAJ3386097.1 histidinol-phosphate transaminase [Entophlyctis sp. JEL0112]